MLSDLASAGDWTAIAVDFVRAFEPRVLLDIGEGGSRFLTEASALCAVFGGRVISIRDSEDEVHQHPALEVRMPRVPESVPDDIRADLVVTHGVAGWWPTAWALAAAIRPVDEPAPVIVVASERVGPRRGATRGGPRPAPGPART